MTLWCILIEAPSTGRGARGQGWQAGGGLYTLRYAEVFLLGHHSLILAVLMAPLPPNLAPSLHSTHEPWGNRLRGGGDSKKERQVAKGRSCCPFLL